MATIQASVPMPKVLKAWGVENVYGLPGGSFDSTMNALWVMRDEIRYVGVKHEKVGTIAAVAEGKQTGRIGVCFGLAGPGAAHLINGLLDANFDNIPTLAIIAQVPSSTMNTDYFQEHDEKPWSDGISVYNRVVMTVEQLPMVIDTAIRDEDVTRTLDLLAEARRPIIYYGRGAKKAGQELQDLSAKLNIPLVSS